MNGERSLLPAQRKETQLKHIYVIYVQLYFNRAGIRPDYANYIFAKHKTDSAKSYSHYTRFYALIGRVCIPAKTRGFSSSNRNKEGLRKGTQPAKHGDRRRQQPNPPSIPKAARGFAPKARNSERDKRPPQPRPSFSHTIRGRSRSMI